MQSAVDWLAGLSPWPTDGFGTERMLELLDRLGHPQRSFDSIHVVGTKGKSTAARTARGNDRRARLYLAARVGVARAPADRPGRGRGGDRSGPGRRRGGLGDAVRDTHGRRLPRLQGARRPGGRDRGRPRRPPRRNERHRRARRPAHERRASSTPRCSARRGRRSPPRSSRSLGPVRRSCSPTTSSPGSSPARTFGWAARRRRRRRFSVGRSNSPTPRCPAGSSFAEREVRDGAHTPDAADWLLERLPEPGGYVVVASILEDKDAAGILVRLAGAGDTLVATRSSNDRALPAAVLAERGRAAFAARHAVRRSR